MSGSGGSSGDATPLSATGQIFRFGATDTATSHAASNDSPQSNTFAAASLTPVAAVTTTPAALDQHRTTQRDGVHYQSVTNSQSPASASASAVTPNAVASPLTAGAAAVDVSVGVSAGSPVVEACQIEIRDRYHIIYFCFMLLGIGFLLPYNATITAVDYLHFAYPDAPIEFILAVVYTFCNLLTVGVNLWVGLERASPFAKLWAGFAVLFTVLLITPETRNLLLYCVLSGIVSCGDGIIQSTLFGLAAQLPKRYTAAIMVGNGSAGVVAALLRVITKVSYPHTEDGLVQSSRVYFYLSAALTACCGVAVWIVKTSQYTRQFYRTYDPTLIGANRDSSNSHPVAAPATNDADSSSLPSVLATTKGTYSSLSSTNLHTGSEATAAATEPNPTPQPSARLIDRRARAPLQLAGESAQLTSGLPVSTGSATPAPVAGMVFIESNLSPAASPAIASDGVFIQPNFPAPPQLASLDDHASPLGAGGGGSGDASPKKPVPVRRSSQPNVIASAHHASGPVVRRNNSGLLVTSTDAPPSGGGYSRDGSRGVSRDASSNNLADLPLEGTTVQSPSPHATPATSGGGIVLVADHATMEDVNLDTLHRVDLPVVTDDDLPNAKFASAHAWRCGCRSCTDDSRSSSVGGWCCGCARDLIPSGHRDVLYRLRYHASAVCIVFILTLALFPGVVSELKSVHKWSGDWFGVTLFVIFQCFDQLGRSLPQWQMFVPHSLRTGAPPINILRLSLSRLILVPFIILSLYMTRTAVADDTTGNPVLASEWFALFVIALFAGSNGYVASICMTDAAASVGHADGTEHELIGTVMALFLVVGLCVGAFIGLGISQI